MTLRPLTCQACGRTMHANRGFIAQHGWRNGIACAGAGELPLEAKGARPTVRWDKLRREWKELEHPNG